MTRWYFIALAALALSACSKETGDPQIFQPRLVGKDGSDQESKRAEACDASLVDLHGQVITRDNFANIFRCANYDHSLDDLGSLFNSGAFTDLVNNVNLILKAGNTRSLHDSLRDWFADGPNGTSRVDRLLPLLASIIKNPSFQAFLPVCDHILAEGRAVWNEVLPSLADVVYTERYPYNLEDAFDIYEAYSNPNRDGQERDYAKSVKSYAHFLHDTTIDGKSAPLFALELLSDVKNLAPAGTSLYEFFDHALEKGSISLYFLNAGTVRGEVVDPKLNQTADPDGEACEGLNDTPEQRQQCAYERLFRQPAGGGDAPIVQLAGLVAELEEDHPGLIPALANWFSVPENGRRVSNAIGEYAIRGRIVQNEKPLDLGAFLIKFAQQRGQNLNDPVDAAGLQAVLQNAFASPDFQSFLAGAVSSVSTKAFGPRNAALIGTAELSAQLTAFFQSPSVLGMSARVLPNGKTTPLKSALPSFRNVISREDAGLEFGGKKQSLDRHLGDFWLATMRAKLGEDVVLDYVIGLAQTFANDWAADFRDKKEPLAEWYFRGAYGDPGTTESLVGYALNELDLLPKYYQNRDWIENDFANEVFGDQSDDKRAFRLLVDQVPNMILYVRSGMSRSGSDLTRALVVDSDGYLLTTYVKLIANAYNVGWIRKGARLIEAWQARPDRAPWETRHVSDDVGQREKTKRAVEAVERIARTLIDPQTPGDYSTSTLGRLMKPLGDVASPGRRADTENFLLASSAEVLKLTDQQINDFFRDFNPSRPNGSPSDQLETYRAVADLLRNPSFPDVVRNVSGLFQDHAVQPALKFLAEKIDDGTLPKLLLFIRRVLGYGA